MAQKYDWRYALDSAYSAVLSGLSTWESVAVEIGIPRKTLTEGFFRNYGIRKIQDISDFMEQQNRELPETAPDFDDSDRIRISEEENGLNIDYGSFRIKTLDEILSTCKVDLSIWEVERYVINKWEIGAKINKKRIQWEDGKIVGGFIENNGEIAVEPLFQVKVWLKRKKPEAQFATLQPVQINVTKFPTRNLTSHGLKAAIIIPDIQFGFTTAVNANTTELVPFHDRHALDVALQIAEMEEFDSMIFLGDGLDLPDWTSHFLRSPDFFFNTQSTITEAAWWLGQFRLSVPHAQAVYLEGNHEKRLQTAIMENLSAAYNLRTAASGQHPILSVPNLLDLDSLDIRYIGNYPNNDHWLGNHVVCIHGDVARGNPGATAAKLVNDNSVTTICGHVHRLEMVSRTIYQRDETRVIHGVSAGCLCRIDGTVPGSSPKSQWQQGLIIVHYDEDSGNHTITPIPIRRGYATYKGYMVQARNRLKDLRHDTNWNF